MMKNVCDLLKVAGKKLEQVMKLITIEWLHFIDHELKSNVCFCTISGVQFEKNS